MLTLNMVMKIDSGTWKDCGMMYLSNKSDEQYN